MRLTLLLIASLFASCGRGSLTSPTEPATTPNAARGLVAVTPSGWFAIHGHRYGAVLPWHIENADAAWRRVAPCVGVPLDRASAYPILLLASGEAACGVAGLAGCYDPERGVIEVIGASWDFDPAHPEESPGPTAEIARLFRHELVHLALSWRDGDADGNHARPEWSCQHLP